MKTPLALAASLTLVLATSAPAWAQSRVEEKAACIAAATKGQQLRESHKLLLARDEFRLCARPACPKVLQTDCGTWLEEMKTTVPTVILAAKDGAGADVTDVKVLVDGASLVAKLDGQPVAIDPGAHTFRFERADGQAMTVQLVVNEAQQGQLVSAAFAPVVTTTPGRTQRIAALAVGGAGIVTVGSSIALGLVAKSQDRAAATEPGVARQTDSASAFSQGTTATVLFGVGAAMAAAGVVLWLTAPGATAKPAIGTNGHELLVRVRF